MRLKVYSKDFSSCVEDEILGFRQLEEGVGVVALRQYLVACGANMRQGNACAKDRGGVSGSGKKPYRQKGTGMARQGSKRSPIWAGGGVVFGPKPRDFSQKINKKVKSLALSRAICDKVSCGELCAIDELDIGSHRTKELDRLVRVAFGDGDILFIDVEFERNFLLASRNIPNVFTVDAASFNALDALRYKNVVFSRGALEAVSLRLKGVGE